MPDTAREHPIIQQSRAAQPPRPVTLLHIYSLVTSFTGPSGRSLSSMVMEEPTPTPAPTFSTGSSSRGMTVEDTGTSTEGREGEGEERIAGREAQGNVTCRG